MAVKVTVKAGRVCAKYNGIDLENREAIRVTEHMNNYVRQHQDRRNHQ